MRWKPFSNDYANWILNIFLYWVIGFVIIVLVSILILLVYNFGNQIVGWLGKAFSYVIAPFLIGALFLVPKDK